MQFLLIQIDNARLTDAYLSSNGTPTNKSINQYIFAFVERGTNSHRRSSMNLLVTFPQNKEIADT
jgi:hypothetical protein